MHSIISVSRITIAWFILHFMIEIHRKKLENSTKVLCGGGSVLKLKYGIYNTLKKQFLKEEICTEYLEE